MKREDGKISISASLFRPHSSVFGHISLDAILLFSLAFHSLPTCRSRSASHGKQKRSLRAAQHPLHCENHFRKGVPFEEKLSAI
jgi:hypothetical protein